MALISRKPTSPGRRFQTASDFAEITRGTPEKSLVKTLTKTGGRNNNGRVTTRHRGGGHKRRYRLIDFKRNKLDVPAKVATIEYDPNRTVRIALLHYLDGDKSYILAPMGLTVGDQVISSVEADIKPGNSLPLQNIPAGTRSHRAQRADFRATSAGQRHDRRRHWSARHRRSDCDARRPWDGVPGCRGSADEGPARR